MVAGLEARGGVAGGTGPQWGGGWGGARARARVAWFAAKAGVCEAVLGLGFFEER